MPEKLRTPFRLAKRLALFSAKVEVVGVSGGDGPAFGEKSKLGVAGRIV